MKSFHYYYYYYYYYYTRKHSKYASLLSDLQRKFKCVSFVNLSMSSRDENKWLILEGRERMKIPTLSEKSFIRPVNLLYLPN